MALPIHPHVGMLSLIVLLQDRSRLVFFVLQLTVFLLLFNVQLAEALAAVLVGALVPPVWLVVVMRVPLVQQVEVLVLVASLVLASLSLVMMRKFFTSVQGGEALVVALVLLRLQNLEFVLVPNLLLVLPNSQDWQGGDIDDLPVEVYSFIQNVGRTVPQPFHSRLLEKAMESYSINYVVKRLLKLVGLFQ